MIHKLINEALFNRLIQNRLQSREYRRHGKFFDPFPVVKLFTPDAQAVWLLSEIDPDEADIAFGLIDLGLGSPISGVVSLLDITSIRGALGLPVERDLYFKADKTMFEYIKTAYTIGYIET